MTREDKRAYNYARDRLANEDYPVYSDEYELKLAYKAGIEDAKNHPHWISVEDELPPKKDENKKHSIEVLGWYGENRVDRIYYDYANKMWLDSFFYRNPPTHWMPLPKMPVLSKSGNTGKDLKGGEE